MTDTTPYLDECGYRIDELEYPDSWGWKLWDELLRYHKGYINQEEFEMIRDKYMAGEWGVDELTRYKIPQGYSIITILPQWVIKNKEAYQFISKVIEDCEAEIKKKNSEIDFIYRRVPRPNEELRDYIDNKRNIINYYSYVIEKFSFYKTIASPWRKKDVKVIDTSMAKSVTIQEILGISKQHTDRQFIPCPIHKESTPSCCIYNSQNTWHCYGCGAGGDSIDLVQKLHSLSFPEALRFITDTYG